MTHNIRLLILAVMAIIMLHACGSSPDKGEVKFRTRQATQMSSGGYLFEDGIHLNHLDSSYRVGDTVRDGWNNRYYILLERVK
jgi:hypothetical protein